MKHIITITLMTLTLAAFGQGRNEYEKKYLQVYAETHRVFTVVSDDSPGKNRRQELRFPNGEKVESLSGLFGYLESIGFEYYTQATTGYPDPTNSMIITNLLFRHKEDKRFNVVSGQIYIIN